MAYKTKREKQAYKRGLLNGLKRRAKKKVSTAKKKRPRSGKQNNPFGMTYHQMLREDAMRKRDLLGDFDLDSRGRIKGAYTPDGLFEPD